LHACAKLATAHFGQTAEEYLQASAGRARLGKDPESGYWRAASMASLRELLGVSPKRQEVIRDAVKVLDAEVADKSGLSGLAVKGAYAVVKGISPGFIQDTIDHLLDDFLDALEPLYAEAKAANASPRAHIASNRSRMAESLLSITDRRAERAQRAVVKKTYEKLRPTAKGHVEAAAPRVGELLERHAPTAG
jgi:hypothetical protein